MIASRRGFVGGLIGLVAAPAVIRVADLMAINPGLGKPDLLTIDDYAERVIRPMVEQFVERFEAEQAQLMSGVVSSTMGGTSIGDVLRVRLPSNYTVGPPLNIQGPETELRSFIVMSPSPPAAPVIPAPAAVALGAAALIASPVPVSRRFWAG